MKRFMKVLVMFGIFCVSVSYAQTVSVPDAQLKAAIQAELGIAINPTVDLTVPQMESLTTLDASYKGVTDLTGLKSGTSLIDLRLQGNQISNLSELSGLTDLIRLYLDHNQISDISALSGLTNLVTLYINNNQVSDISILAEFTNLYTLSIAVNPISNILPLAGLTTNLHRLFIYQASITDISDLSGLTNLTELRIGFNNIGDINDLSGLTNLVTLYLAYIQISNVSVLSGMANLGDVHLNGNQISDISSLSGLTNLTALNLLSNPLNQEACDTYLPQMKTNNPTASILHDACPVSQYTVTVHSSAGGSTDQLASQTVNHGDTLIITPSPAAGYSFTEWSGDASGSNNPLAVIVTSAMSITANFASNTYSLSYNAVSNGSISGITPQTVNSGSNGTAVTAVGDAGYEFLNWSDDSTANPRTDTNVTADVTVTANFVIIPINTHSLIYSAGPNGSISGTTPQTVNNGANGTAVTAVAATGYHFINWSDSSTANPRTDTNVTANVTVTANFGINTHSLTYVAGANGTINGISPQTVNNGANGTVVTAVSAAGYNFVNWSDGSTANPRTDTNVTANVTVIANFGINSHSLTYIAGANGSISGVTPQVVSNGTNGTAVTAVAATGYHFINWSDSSTANPRTDTNVTANVSVTANFGVNTHSLIYSAGPNGSISGTTAQTVNHGANGTAVTAVAAAGYQFVNWSDGSTTNPRTDTNVTANVTVTANFGISTHSLTYIAGANGSISGTTSQTVNNGANGTAVTAVSAAGYHFVDWSDGSTSNPRTDTIVTANMSVTASFGINTYSLTYIPGANGSISGTASQTVNHGSNGTAVTAVAAAGYHFVSWSDGSISNPRIDTIVTANMSVTASFAINVYSLTYIAGANGSISGTTLQTVNHGSSGTAVTSVVAAGYHFVNWSDGSTANPRIDTNVTANKTVTANSAINQYTVTVGSTAGGSTDKDGSNTVSHGGTLTITPSPTTGYRFSGWGGDASGMEIPLILTVTTNMSITANFEQDRHFSVMTRPILNGDVTISSAILQGEILDALDGTDSRFRFRYFKKSDGHTAIEDTEERALNTSNGEGRFSQLVEGLEPGTTYVYQVRAYNSEGRDSGPYMEFTTDPLSSRDILYVDDNAMLDPGPNDLTVSDPDEDGSELHPFDGIQKAIDVARDHVRILVREGRYTERLTFTGRSIEVNGLELSHQDRNRFPIIDANDEGVVVTFDQGEDANCILAGFVLTRGYDSQAGAIACIGSSPTILNCLVVGNRCTGPGSDQAVIYCENSNSLFKNCTIADNYGGVGGSGIGMTNCSVVLSNSILWGNAPEQILVASGDEPIVMNTSLNTDPLFALPGYWILADGLNLLPQEPYVSFIVWLEGDYHLQSRQGRYVPGLNGWTYDNVTSSSIDLGDPVQFVGDETFPNGNRINVGAYGGTWMASHSE